MSSLVGVVALYEVKPGIHVHVVLGRHACRVMGRHLLEARVRPTLEVLMVDSPAQRRREHDPKSGLPRSRSATGRHES